VGHPARFRSRSTRSASRASIDRRHARHVEPPSRGVPKPDRVGIACHQVIATLLEQDLRDPSFEDMRRVVDEHPLLQAFTTPRLHSRQRLLAAVGAYFGLYRRDPRDVFLGSEQQVGSDRVDLVFSGRDGIQFDELKTGRSLDVGADVAEQAGRYLKAGVARWGDDFGGVRVLFLASGAQSFLLTSDGEMQPVEAIR